MSNARSLPHSLETFSFTPLQIIPNLADIVLSLPHTLKSLQWNDSFTRLEQEDAPQRTLNECRDSLASLPPSLTQIHKFFYDVKGVTSKDLHSLPPGLTSISLLTSFFPPPTRFTNLRLLSLGVMRPEHEKLLSGDVVFPSTLTELHTLHPTQAFYDCLRRSDLPKFETLSAIQRIPLPIGCIPPSTSKLVI